MWMAYRATQHLDSHILLTLNWNLRGPVWAVGSYSSGPPAGGTFVLMSTEHRIKVLCRPVEKWSVSTFYWQVHVEILERVTHTKRYSVYCESYSAMASPNGDSLQIPTEVMFWISRCSSMNAAFNWNGLVNISEEEWSDMAKRLKMRVRLR